MVPAADECLLGQSGHPAPIRTQGNVAAKGNALIVPVVLHGVASLLAGREDFVRALLEEGELGVKAGAYA